MKSRDWMADVAAIRKLLMSDWDPIGCGVPDDEYDGYIPAIYDLVQSRVSVEELAAFLQEIETESICLDARPDVNRRVAESLLANVS